MAFDEHFTTTWSTPKICRQNLCAKPQPVFGAEMTVQLASHADLHHLHELLKQAAPQSRVTLLSDSLPAGHGLYRF